MAGSGSPYLGGGNIQDCIFKTNSSAGGGGGGAICAYCSTGQAVNMYFTNCQFIGNTAYGISGGMNLTFTLNPIIISNCSFIGNSSSEWTADGGAALYISSTNIDLTNPIKNCIFRDNYFANNVQGTMGLVVNANRSVSLQNCIITNNTGRNNGSLINFAQGGSLLNCTLANNAALGSSGTGISTTATTVSVPTGKTATITNNIFWANQGASNLGGAGTYTNSYNAYITTGDGGTGSITTLNASNTFVSPPGFIGAPSTSDGGIQKAASAAADWSLISGCPAINAGADLSGSGITTDIAGNSRPSGSAEVDMGAYEYISYQSNTSGNWEDYTTWHLSADGSTFSDLPSSAYVPTSSMAGSVSILNGHTVTIASNATSRTLTVNGGAKLTNNSTLNATTFNILSDPTNGTGTYLDNGTTTYTTANVRQYLGLSSASTARNWYISSPVSGAVVPANQTFFGYQEDGTNGNLSATGSTAYWKPYAAAISLTLGKGYIAQPGSATTLTFTGTLNAGDKPSPNLSSTIANISSMGYNLIGNPYPSYLNVLPSIAANANLDQTVWYRTQGTETPTPLYHFETVNVSSGTGTNYAGTGQVTGYIPPMQAFWVHTNADAQTITFLNANRSHAGIVTLTDGNNTQVPTTLLKARVLESNAQGILRLNVSNGNTGDETIIYTNAKASNGYDNYDSRKMSNNNAAIPEIYTTVGNEQLVINGMNSIAPDTEIPLGFTTGQSNVFSIKANEFSNFDSDTKVYLKDNLLNTEQDLTDGTAYTFASDVASTTSRFSVVFKSVGVTTGVQAASNDPSILIYKNANNQIAVNCNGSISDNAFISVYNALGQKLELKQITSITTLIGRTFTSGVYMVTVNNGEKSTTKKVILN